jgi:hypothetical protein
MENTYGILDKLLAIAEATPGIGDAYPEIFSNASYNLFNLIKIHTPPANHGDDSSEFLYSDRTASENESENGEDLSMEKVENSEADPLGADIFMEHMQKAADSISDIAKIFSPSPEKTEEWQMNAAGEQHWRSNSSSSEMVSPLSFSSLPLLSNHHPRHRRWRHRHNGPSSSAFFVSMQIAPIILHIPIAHQSSKAFRRAQARYKHAAKKKKKR